MEILQTLSLLVGSSFLTGWNAYATIGFLGLFGRLGWLQLPDSLHVLTNPAVFVIALFLFLIEFLADKIPAVDSFWDAVHTFVRIPAGAILAYAAVGPVDPALKIAAGLLGGSLAFAAHTTKSSLRLMVNLSPEPFSNWVLSFSQDGILLVLIWVMFHLPFLMLFLVGIFLVFFFWFSRKIFRGFGKLFGKSPTSPQPS
jgi:uncharacterized protein DUF4126